MNTRRASRPASRSGASHQWASVCAAIAITLFLVPTPAHADETTSMTGAACDYLEFSAGADHTCGLRSDHTVACWGNNTFGQSDAPAGTFAQVSAGGYHTCGVRSDGTVACWGWNADGQSPPFLGELYRFSQVGAGYRHTCGVRLDGTVACWGTNYRGESRPPACEVDTCVPDVDCNRDHAANALDLQLMVNGILGLDEEWCDPNHDLTSNALDLQLVVNCLLDPSR